MTRKEKRLSKIRQNPSNVSFDELRQVLEDYGFVLERAKGSHHVFRAEVSGQVWTLTIPAARPVKVPYVRQSVRAIAEIQKALETLKQAEEEAEEADDEQSDD